MITAAIKFHNKLQQISTAFRNIKVDRQEKKKQTNPHLHVLRPPHVEVRVQPRIIIIKKTPGVKSQWEVGTETPASPQHQTNSKGTGLTVSLSCQQLFYMSVNHRCTGDAHERLTNQLPTP